MTMNDDLLLKYAAIAHINVCRSNSLGWIVSNRFLDGSVVARGRHDYTGITMLYG